MIPAIRRLNVEDIEVTLVKAGKFSSIPNFSNLLPVDRRMVLRDKTLLDIVLETLKFNQKDITDKVIKYKGPAEFVDNMMYFKLDSGEDVSLPIQFAVKAYESPESVYNGYFYSERIIQFISAKNPVRIGNNTTDMAVLIHYSGKGLIGHINRIWGRVEVHE